MSIKRYIFLITMSLSILCCLVTKTKCYAASLENTYQMGQEVGQSQLPSTTQSLHQFSPNDIFAHFNPAPSETRYFQEEMTVSTSLANDAVTKVTTNETAKLITNSIQQRPQFEEEDNSIGIQRSQRILSDATAITQGLLHQYPDCQSIQRCQTTYTTHTCQENRLPQSFTCTNDLIVNAIPGNTFDYTVTLTLQGTLYNSHSLTVTVDLSTGKVLSPLNTLEVQLSSFIPSSFPCTNAQISVVNTQALYREYPTQMTVKQLPDCLHPLQVTITVSSDKQFVPVRVAGRITFHLFSKSPPTIREEWRDNCAGDIKKFTEGACSKEASPVCTSGNATKMINGVSITRSCWQTQTHYRCNEASAQQNSCNIPRQQGCEQVGSVCRQPTNAGCFDYQQTFRCPTNNCTQDVGIVCNGETFCFSGDCTHVTRKPDQDFQSSVSKLSAINSAAKDFDSAVVFKGYPSHCGNDAVGYSNCCRESGWGMDLHLAQCSQEEKQLGHDKALGLTVYVGEDCKHRVLGVCRSKQKVYCRFPSKLARIVQQQGRRQLGFNFGKGSRPDCRGLTPDQLQKIDFSKIDFSEVYKDLPSTQPSSTQAQQIKAHIEAWEEREQSHANN